jgi:hypothetical protein
MDVSRFALLAVVGVVLLPVGLVTLIVGLIEGDTDTARIGVIELAGGAMFGLIGAAVFVYFRRADVDRDSPEEHG